MEDTPTANIKLPTKVQKAKDHVARHKKSYGAAGIVAAIPTVVTLLQLVGALGPILCSMPFVHDKAMCVQAVDGAKRAAGDLGELDAMKLDQPTAEATTVAPIPTTTVEQ